MRRPRPPPSPVFFSHVSKLRPQTHPPSKHAQRTACDELARLVLMRIAASSTGRTELRRVRSARLGNPFPFFRVYPGGPSGTPSDTIGSRVASPQVHCQWKKAPTDGPFHRVERVSSLQKGRRWWVSEPDGQADALAMDASGVRLGLGSDGMKGTLEGRIRERVMHTGERRRGAGVVPRETGETPLHHLRASSLEGYCGLLPPRSAMAVLSLPHVPPPNPPRCRSRKSIGSPGEIHRPWSHTSVNPIRVYLEGNGSESGGNQE
eukprot:scaffold2846_cov322-Pavlova_lutheri.AAC.8